MHVIIIANNNDGGIKKLIWTVHNLTATNEGQHSHSHILYKQNIIDKIHKYAYIEFLCEICNSRINFL